MRSDLRPVKQPRISRLRRPKLTIMPTAAEPGAVASVDDGGRGHRAPAYFFRGGAYRCGRGGNALTRRCTGGIHFFEGVMGDGTGGIVSVEAGGGV